MDSNHKASRKVSRRAVLGTAAGAGAVGAAGALGIASFVGNKDSEESSNAAAITSDNEDTTSAAALRSADIMDDSLVFWMPNRNGNTVMFYNGVASASELKDPKLIAEMKRIAKQ